MCCCYLGGKTEIATANTHFKCIPSDVRRHAHVTRLGIIYSMELTALMAISMTANEMIAKCTLPGNNDHSNIF